MRAVVALLGLGLCASLVVPARAAGGAPRAPGGTGPPDPYGTVFPRSVPPPHSHTRAHVALAVGAALTVTSFVLSADADRDYRRYQADSDPAAIERDYDAARRNDRWSAATLLAGTGALALGVYWRFIREPADAREDLETRVGLAPSVSPRRAGLALRVDFR